MTSAKKSQSPKGENAGEISFEAALARLEEIVARLEEGEVPLEESLAAYAEGTRLVKRCLERLEKAETMIRELSEGAEGFRLERSSLEGEPDGEEDRGEEDDAEADVEEEDSDEGDDRLF